MSDRHRAREQRRYRSHKVRRASFALVAGDTQRAETASVEAGMESDKLVFSRVQPGQFQSSLDGLRAAVAKEGFRQARGARCAIFSARSAIGWT
jgi:hypothetical protein